MSRSRTMSSLEDVLELGRAKAGLPPTTPASRPTLAVSSSEDLPTVEDDVRLRARRRAMGLHGFGVTAKAAELVVQDRLFSTAALSIAQAWVKAPTPVLVLVGDPGVGKSVALSWAALERLTKGEIVYVLESELAEWRWARRQHAADLARIAAAPTVIIAEVGRTEAARKELARIAVAELLLTRTTGKPWGRKTALDGNLSLEDLSEALDPRVEDRLAEIGSVRHLAGPSLRGQS